MSSMVASDRVRSGGSVVASVVRAIGTVIALILLAHVIFVLVSVNEANALVQFVASAASALALWFVNLFDTGNATMDLLLNYGLAIVFWLVVTGIVARLLRRTA
ncbi:hypothetical protein SAMN04489726_6053 [Allokutzneria albata]|uniref:Uncharacterized protein n=2 Tax=Allokutzneria albata TaxID=211114 RepID=A0A1H0AFJ0_ALLAB|nr:hypothetical protein SAMN04489726_6053 [Allokutzneria albata]